MTTANDLLERTRRHLYTERRDERNRLTSTITSGATSLAVDFDAAGIQKGAALAVELEEMYVWEVNSSTATISRGEGGSTAAAHTAGVAIFVNPKFSAFSILQAINDELLSLSGEGLFQVKRLSVDYDTDTDTYNLTGVTDLLDIIEVSYESTDSQGRWPLVDRSLWNLQRSMPTADFASGLALTVNGYAEPGSTLNVVYKAPFVALSALADNVETVAGLPSSAHDIVPLGAAIRLTVGAEVARNFLDQGDTRRSDEVPAQARSSEMRALAALRRDRINEERARLYTKFPTRR